MLVVLNVIWQDGRFKDTEENRPIFKLKVKVIKTINLFFNFRFYLRLQVSNDISYFVVISKTDINIKNRILYLIISC